MASEGNYSDFLNPDDLVIVIPPENIFEMANDFPSQNLFIGDHIVISPFSSDYFDAKIHKINSGHTKIIMSQVNGEIFVRRAE